MRARFDENTGFLLKTHVCECPLWTVTLFCLQSVCCLNSLLEDFEPARGQREDAIGGLGHTRPYRHTVQG